MLFAEIVGQDLVKKKLIEGAQKGRISHAQLFLGAPGYGTLPLAIAYAQFISCQNAGANDACGTCSSCLKYQKLIHPDLHFVYPVNTTKSVTKKPTSVQFLPSWREAVLEKPYMDLFEWLAHIGIENKQGNISAADSQEVLRTLSLRSYEAGYKVTIIWMAEKMNQSAANKLLKMIEEPPDKTIFLLIAENQEHILPTILSRTQLVPVKRIGSEDMKQALMERFGVTSEAAASLAHQADGDFHQALQLVQHNEDEDISDLFISWMRLCYMRDIIKIVPWVDSIGSIGRERQKNFLKYAMHLIRECMLLISGADALTRLEGKERAFITKFSPFVAGEYGATLAQELDRSIRHVERNANPRILFMDLSLKTVKLLAQSSAAAKARA